MVNLEQEQQKHLEKVQDYYAVTLRFYKYFWDKLGLHYGFWTKDVVTRRQAILEENKELADLAKIKSGDFVLDSGCGIAGSDVWLAENRGANVVCLNIVDRQIKNGKDLVKKRKLDRYVKFEKGDYHKLSFKDNVFDVYWSLESIEHAYNLGKFMNEAFRVLKSGGRIIIAGTFLGNKAITSEEKRQIEIGQSAAGCFNDFRSAEANATLMKEVGFTDVQVFDKTREVMESARQMTKICRLGLPVAEALSAVHIVSPILILNNQWGTYQEGLFKSGATSYNVIVARKP